MADVVTYCKNGSPVLNGSVIVYSDKLGNKSSISGETIASSVYTSLEVQYSGRFDDPRYYTGDATT